MKRALSIASVGIVAAFVAGVMFLLPRTVPPEVIEQSVIHEQNLLEKAWRLPTASAFGHHDALGSVTLGLRHGAYCVGCWVLMALLFVGGA
jgi:hypothetical protein